MREPILSSDDLKALLATIIHAEALPLPGPAKQAWVIADQSRYHSHSLPPVWVWLLVKLLDALIPELINWLKQHYGNTWPARTKHELDLDRLPWQNSEHPQP